MTLTSIVLRDEADNAMGYVRQSIHKSSISWSGWLWACALCPAANPPGGGSHNPDTAVRHVVEHIKRRHPSEPA